jgi:hypothetical protein
MTPVQSFAVLLLIMPTLGAQTSDFRNTSWGMDRSQVVATEATPPSQVREGGGEIVLRYESARIAGLDCRVVYIFAKDKLVRAKYVFQQEHDGKNDFLADFAIVDAFLTGTLDRATEQRVSWRNDTYKMEPQHYGLAVSLGQASVFDPVERKADCRDARFNRAERSHHSRSRVCKRRSGTVGRPNY